MKILHIIPSLDKGGAERLVLDITRYIIRSKKSEVKLVIFRDEIEYEIEDILEFIKIIPSRNIVRNFVNIFRVPSHSYPRAKSIWYDIGHYRIQNWKNTLEKQFKIEKLILPCLYPYPDYPQFFKLHCSNFGASSVFFICKKK